MKQTLLAIICLLSATALFAQIKEWKEMDDFHAVMAKSYHPVEKGNLQPLKENIDSLVTRAKAWQASAIPAVYATKSIKPILDKLVTDCLAIKESINRKQSDTILKEQVTRAHQTFHEIMEKCEE
jgi:hypothetical protein